MKKSPSSMVQKKRTIPFSTLFCASQILNHAWNLLNMSPWSSPFKVKQHVALLPNPFFAGVCLGSGNEARNYLPSDGAYVHSSLAHIQCMEQGIAVTSGNRPITTHTQNITQVQSNIVDSLVGSDDFTRKWFHLTQPCTQIFLGGSQCCRRM